MVGFLTLVLASLMMICPRLETQAASIQDKVVISHSSMNARYAHLWMAQERGFFAKHGVDTDVIFVKSGPIQVASVASGDVQIGYAPGVIKKLKFTDPSAAEQGYVDFAKTVERRPYPSLDGFRNIQRLMKPRNPKLEKVRPEDVIDDRILRRLDESGFITDTYVKYGVK